MSQQVSTADPQKRGIIELTIAMLLSGTIGVFVIQSGAEPFTVAFFRCLFGAIALGVYCVARGYFTNTGFTRKTLLLTALGGVFLVFNWAFLFSAYGKTSYSMATIIYHTQPFYVMLLGSVVFKEKLTARRLAWVGVAFIGLILVTDLSSVKQGDNYFLGVGEALLAAVLYALATIVAKKLKGIRPHLIALVQVLVGLPLLLPFVSFANAGHLSSGGWLWLAGIGVVHTCVMYILMYSSYQKLTTALIAVLSFIYPATAIVVDVTVYGTHISPMQIAGVLLILGSSLANSLNWRPGRRKSESTHGPAVVAASK